MKLLEKLIYALFIVLIVTPLAMVGEFIRFCEALDDFEDKL